MLTSSLQRHITKNFPEEDDETMSLRDSADITTDPAHTHLCPTTVDLASQVTVESGQISEEGEPGHRFVSVQPPHSLMAGSAPPTPFPSQTDRCWPRPSLVSGWSLYPDSLRSFQNHSFLSGPSCTNSTSTIWSLEPPLSLHSDPPSWDTGHQPSHHIVHHALSPYACSPQSTPCWAQCCNDSFNRRVRVPAAVGHTYKSTFNPHCPTEGSGFSAAAAAAAAHSCRADEAAVKEKKNSSAPNSYKTLLSLEQRKVFVTYADDDDDHVNEVINFVALLRHNGFDTHIDIFEQQFRSISNIDFMERYLNEREFLIIIVISPKYHHTVTAPPVGVENDERTFNTVYIHKQLQNEFIQNGSKNFRFIPVLFPGAKQCHVPNWLQNTNVYRWPWDRDDILRRLMRVEKYNPPPIGTLPTILSIPL